MPSAEEDDSQSWKDAVLLLQRLVRGRAVQNFMFEGKERRIALIRELRVDETDEARLAAEEMSASQVEGVNQQVQQSAKDTIQGEVVSATVDYLAKELVRNREEGRISTLVADAERTRRKRQAEESGRRQAESDVRSREDKVFNDMLRLHQGTAETYVDEVMDETVDQVATEKAENEAGIKSDMISPPMGKVEDEGNESGEVVKGLVASFLMPEVNRESVKRQVELEERRFVSAAQGAIKEMVETVEQELGKEVVDDAAGNEGKKEEVV